MRLRSQRSKKATARLGSREQRLADSGQMAFVEWDEEVRPTSARSFRVAGEPVTTHAGTRFDDVTCGGLQEGMQLEVRRFR